MQWLAMLATYFFGRKNSKNRSLREMAIEIFDDVSVKSRRIVFLTLTALGSVILFCGGFFITLLESTSQYDRNEYIYLSATLSGGIALVLGGVVAFTTLFAKAWPRSTQHPGAFANTPEEHPRQASTLEMALAALVMDFIKERELRRTPSHLGNEEGPSPKTHDHEASTSATIH